jgi:hypothetical protein
MQGTREHAQDLLSNSRMALALYGPIERAPRLLQLSERLAA